MRASDYTGGWRCPRSFRAGVLAIGIAVGLSASGSLLEAQARADSTEAPPARKAATPGLSGHVVQQDGKPVVGAAVKLVGTSDSAVTADDGGFAIHAPTGAYILSIRRLGFRFERFAVTLAAGEQRDVTIVESRVVPVLPTVTTTAQERAAYRSVGFEQRMQAGNGQFLTYEQIQQRHATRVSQLLDGMRGLQVSKKDPKSFDYSVQGTRGAGSCVG